MSGYHKNKLKTLGYVCVTLHLLEILKSSDINKYVRWKMAVVIHKKMTVTSNGFMMVPFWN